MEIDTELLNITDKVWEQVKAKVERDGDIKPHVIFICEKDPLIMDLTKTPIDDDIDVLDVVSDMAGECQATCVIFITHARTKIYAEYELEQKSPIEIDSDLEEDCC